MCQKVKPNSKQHPPLPWAHSAIQRVWTAGKFEIELWIVVLICGCHMFPAFLIKIISFQVSFDIF